MKSPLPALFLVASIFAAGCNSLDNPLGGLLGTGHDGRVYNSQTGEFEWPKDSPKRRSRRPAPTPAPGATPAAERKSDGRYYDPQKSQWVEVEEEKDEKRSAPQRPKKPSTPMPVLMVTPVPVGTPPAIRPPRARGVYNTSTGQIEWRDFDPAPSATPVPKKKSWYWPF